MQEYKLALLNRLDFNLVFLNRHKHLIGVAMRRIEVTEEYMQVDMALLHEFMQDYASDCLTLCSIKIDTPEDYYSASSIKTVSIHFTEDDIILDAADINAANKLRLFSIIEQILQICRYRFLRL